MLRIRLRRRGKSKYATYRVVLAKHSDPIKGKFIADLGSYNPHTKALVVDAEMVKKFMSQGAQPSATMHNLFVNHKIIDAPKVTTWKPKRKKEAAEAKSA